MNLLAIISTIAVASQITYVQGRGQDFGYCSYTGGSFCISSIKSRAESEAKRDAQWACELKQGTARTYSAYCNSYCSPSFLGPNDDNTPVHCDSTCQMQCELDK